MRIGFTEWQKQDSVVFFVETDTALPTETMNQAYCRHYLANHDLLLFLMPCGTPSTNGKGVN